MFFVFEGLKSISATQNLKTFTNEEIEVEQCRSTEAEASAAL
jgi:hypothetical protein